MDDLNSYLTGQYNLLQLSEKTKLSISSILEHIEVVGAVLTDEGRWFLPKDPEDPEEMSVYLALDRSRKTRQVERKVLGKLVESENRRRDAAQVLSDKTPPLVIKASKSKLESGTAFFVLSDNHYAELINKDETYGTNEHSPKISEERITKIAQRALLELQKICTVQTIERVVLCLLGDHIHGNIHESYVEIHGNAMTVLEETTAVGRLLLGVISLFCQHYQVDVVCIPGNHGRATGKKREKQNMGYSYEQHMFINLKDRAADLGLKCTFHIKNERMQFVTAYGYKVRLMHGDDIYGGSPHTAIPKYLGKLDDVEATKADLTVMGHWHQSFASKNYIINGCTCGPNLYSLTQGYKPENPSQTLFVVTKNGLSYVSFIEAN